MSQPPYDNSEIQLLKDSHDIIDVIEKQGIQLIQDGKEFLGLCPFHDDHNPSLTVNQEKQIWLCRTCLGKNGKPHLGGDMFDFLIEMGNTLPQSIAILKGESVSAIPIKRENTNIVKTLQWKHIQAPGPASVFTHYKHGEPDHIYRYNNKNGTVAGYVCRFELPDGKETLPYIYAKNGNSGVQEWRYLGFQEPYRPLYNSDLIDTNPSATVIMVEGEKCADFINELLPATEFVATTWVGGAGQVGKTDMSQLNGRSIVFWPDHDEPGEKCMRFAMQSINSNKKRFIRIPDGFPKHWDSADSGFNASQLRDFILPPPEVLHTEDESHFKYLGYQKAEQSPVFIFYVIKSRLIVRLAASAMTKSNLITMAPLIWWERNYTFKNTDQATSFLVETSYKVGLYSPKYIRGRGAWYDNGRIVVHAGDQLIVDGIVTKLGELKSRYIYEIGESFEFNTENPLPTSESKKLLEITQMLNFDREVNAHLLAGWCVIAPVCGALNWRPHIWLTGPSGSGKSWVFRDIVRALLGETSLSVQGVTTEAGIRQVLGFDALPVVVDEAEGNERKSTERVQDVIELARSASADDTGKIIKGSASHSAKEFSIRSCFAFASIGVGADKTSDRRRITILTLLAMEDGEEKKRKWAELQRVHGEVITDMFISGLHARTISLLPIILENARVFTKAVTIVLGNQATGDQLGPMIAGAYSLVGEDIIQLDKAIEWVRGQNWNEEKEADSIKDEQELVHAIMQWNLDTDAWGRRTVSELVKISVGMEIVSDEAITPSVAYKRLKRSGIKTKDDKFVVFCANNIEINNKLKETRWSKNYAKTLIRLPGAFGKASRFTGKPEYAIHIPIENFFK